ncbi:MAG: glycine cleavage system protein [Thermomicrobiales bacterium]|jgi:glycine cleavage system H protein|nr:glycine cleavage system protein [Thermomicrobiales bacterium]MEA2523892.1 glycine cleavage system protein [Thermomicrobiales bacterium]MEA2531238.1 glycine cleavage system protein [Thermomicrobiales bacterium]MEA2598238.1 glycine cleavage system protein [Thermomicrobiales bacterium]
MASPKDLRYTKTHEWVRVDGDLATIGLSDHAQSELGDITYLELPDVGDEIAQSDPLGVVESVKAASDIYAPVGGEVVERNEDVVGTPELVNQSPYERAWLIKVRLTDPTQVESLMPSDEYDQFAETAASH